MGQYVDGSGNAAGRVVFFNLDTDEKIFTSKQALNFFNMDIHEQKEEMLKWLKDHNIHQNNQLNLLFVCSILLLSNEVVFQIILL